MWPSPGVSTVRSAATQGEGPRRSSSLFASAGAQSASDVINFSGFARPQAPRMRSGRTTARLLVAAGRAKVRTVTAFAGVHATNGCYDTQYLQSLAVISR